MGMASSQARINFMLNRGNAIRFKLTQLSAQKIDLTNDMNKVTRKYQESLNAKVYMWTNNGGANNTELSYSTMMYPGGSNNNKLYMLTDSRGKVVVDSTYKEYAELISPDGSPGDWEAHRTEVLSQITGVSAEDIENEQMYYSEFLRNREYLYELAECEPDKSAFTKKSADDFNTLLSKIGSCGNITNWAAAFGDPNQTIASAAINEVVEQIKNDLSGYFLDDSDKFEAACDNVASWSSDSVSVHELIEFILGSYQGQGGYFAESAYADPNGETYPVWYDINSPAYANYQVEYAEWKADYESAKEATDAALEAYNQIFTAEVKTKISFYDDLFSSIAENGWAYYEGASDQSYLNEMLQNGMFYITTVDRNLVEGENHEFSYENTYNTDIASNCSHIVSVSDSSVRDLALVQYENEKSTITKKEQSIDQKMKNLETEQSALKTMIDSVKSTLNKNIEHNFNIFS